MPGSVASSPPPGPWRNAWPWLLLLVMAIPAFWIGHVFPDDIDTEFPGVLRPSFSPHPPPAYRLAEPGDTIDRIAIYVSSLAVVLSLTGLRLARDERRPWIAALAVSLAAFWYAANPWPTFDGWHGLAWRTTFDPAAPAVQRLALAAGGVTLAAMIFRGLGLRPAGWADLWRAGRARGVSGLLGCAAVLALVRQVEMPGVEPVGYWPRWAFVWALVAFSSVLIKLQPYRPAGGRRIAVVAGRMAGATAWLLVVMLGIELTRYHRPIDRLRAVVPGRLYMSAMPTGRGLEIAQRRHHFKTIINLFPEDTPYRSPRLPEEFQFVASHHLRYYGSPADVASSNEFLDLTLRVARDPTAWPILVHCHACMDRTPAWVGIYQFVVECRPLDEIFRFIEGHRGLRPKATVTLLYNRVLPRLSPERCMNDPFSALLQRCAEGTTDPYFDQVRSGMTIVNPDDAHAVYARSATRLPSLTPRR